MREQYDYIIVGAGSSGCPLANRLSADPANSVLLIESGPSDNTLLVHMPRGLGMIMRPGSPYIWDYSVHTGGNAPPERWFRGKTLGGSSAINGMVYMRGAPLDYDGWKAMGCDDWGWSEVGAAFAAIEDHDQGAAQWRGKGGPLHITTHPKGNPLYEALLDAATEMGIKRVSDVNSVESVRDGGMGYQPTTRKGGQRNSASRAFLEPIRGRKNLDVATETDVLKIEFEGKRAVGVTLKDKAGVRSVRANREVILSAGAIQSPKLLQLSGIGPAEVLKSVGVDVVHDAPNVGQNLREHRHVDLRMQVKSHSSNPYLSGRGAALSVLAYMLLKRGPMTHAAHEIGGFAKSEPGIAHADLQFGLMSLSMGGARAVPPKPGGARRRGGGGAAQMLGLDPFHGISFVTYFTRPESQGEVRIQSPNPEEQPFVNANHLSTELDRRKFVAAFRWNRLYASQPALKPWVIQETVPGDKVVTDDDILANAMSLGGTCFHTAGTARMGVDDGAVVDTRLRVRGVQGLRVVDTSIMPTLVSGNTNGPAMMIGYKAADYILADRAA